MIILCGNHERAIMYFRACLESWCKLWHAKNGDLPGLFTNVIPILWWKESSTSKYRVL